MRQDSQCRKSRSSHCLAKSVRTHGQSSRPGAELSYAYETNSAAPTGALQTQLPLSLQDGSNVGTDPRQTQVVVHDGQPEHRGQISCPLLSLPSRRTASKMGWGSYSGSDGFGPVVPNGSQVSHQLVRTLGGRKNDPGVRRSVDGLQVHSAVGQFDGGSIHQQTRRYKISPVVHAHSSLVEEVSPSRNVTQGYPHSRGHKHSSGQPLSRPRCGPDRMGTVSSGGPNHLPSNVLSDSGSVCISKQPPTTSILLQDARSKSTGGRRTTLELERNDGSRISSNFAATESNTENSQRRLQHNTHSTLLAKASMVSAHGEPSHRYTSVSSTVTRPPETAGSGDSGADHSAGSSEVNCMAVIRQRCEESGFSQKAANLIADGRTDSTLGIYSGRLGRYYKWCEKTNCSPARATQSQIADFLTEVFDSGLQVATVSNYKSAIAAIHRGFEDGSTLYKNDYIRLLLNGMYNSRPPKRRIVPAWNLSKVLELLKGAPYEPMKSATLREITLKTVFLVALATGRRRSELQALSFKTLVFSRNGVSMTFKVGFIAKMSRRFNTGPSCFRGLALSHRLWCPERTIEHYIYRTSNIRGSTDQLFITHAKPNKAASKQTLARWLVSLIVDAKAFEGTCAPRGTFY
ncbi:uncharacterized protein [Amphiura filiformis]|uniref:uncharacterized protein n=1 Tax=Amphiura filiformis TaxID=82378 RepID=UPI003B227316